MEGLEMLLGNGSEVTFMMLFVFLLGYVMKTNDKREDQYRQTIATLSVALAGYEDLGKAMNDIKAQITDHVSKGA